jgi:uncharacterized Zn-finger protein
MKPYVCEQCRKPFTFISYLRTHEGIHTGEKTFA